MIKIKNQLNDNRIDCMVK